VNGAELPVLKGRAEEAGTDIGGTVGNAVAGRRRLSGVIAERGA
jgi:hypothetical protein